ncbi:alpha/beta hydrolase fold domain-containing protein [Pseudomonas phytophila]|uniref:alpha/beta hydrolase n=1 Tax=Pseudomonas phytophila TaxID=2867264 RepID=UPI0021DA9DFF
MKATLQKKYEFAPSNRLSPDPGASPVFADVRGLPPILVWIGENEVMLGDAMRFASHLGRTGYVFPWMCGQGCFTSGICCSHFAGRDSSS